MEEIKTYTTSQIANIIGIHPNTVRFYEEAGLITKPVRKSNGYRVFSDIHLEQFRLARIALRAEVIQNGMRKKAVDIIKMSANGDYDQAIKLTYSYLSQINMEQRNAAEAIDITKQLLSNSNEEDFKIQFTRKETADYLNITIDTLRNWELNGLLNIKRKRNGYRIYDSNDIKRLKIIRALRCANYSLSSILRMFYALSVTPDVNLQKIIDTPEATEDIISVCDRLLTSLSNLEQDAEEMLYQLNKIKMRFTNNPPV